LVLSGPAGPRLSADLPSFDGLVDYAGPSVRLFVHRSIRRVSIYFPGGSEVLTSGSIHLPGDHWSLLADHRSYFFGFAFQPPDPILAFHSPYSALAIYSLCARFGLKE